MLLSLVASGLCSAQTVETYYYTNRSLENITERENAKYSETITTTVDGKITKTVTNLKKNIVEFSETLKGEEPFGMWVSLMGSGTEERDYDFQLNYGNKNCPVDSLIINAFQSNAAMNYTAPALTTGEQSISQFLGRNLRYPAFARRRNIQGKVTLKFTITEQGTIENISVYKGVHVQLDKEAARVLRKMKLTGPPTVNGQPKSLCSTIDIGFRLD